MKTLQPDISRINNTMGKMKYYLDTHSSICVSVSGGSDSTIIAHMISFYFPEYLPKVHFVFADTGIEFRATLRYLDNMEEEYGIKIDQVRGMPIPVCVKKYGTPFFSKKVSDSIQRLQKHGFDWSDDEFEELYKRFPKNKASLRWWCKQWGNKSRFNISTELKNFLISEKPSIKISKACCDKSKKEPLLKYQKKFNCDLYITGERKVEGGARATVHKSCFEKHLGMDHFMPLWFWDDETKEFYKEYNGIKYSDCYEVYGMTRTGCVGCPYGQNIKEELEVMKKYEPQCYKLCKSVFGDSYKLIEKLKGVAL